MTAEDTEKQNPLGVRTTERETIVCHPHHGLADRDIDMFFMMVRTVSAFSRGLDASSATELPSLQMAAAAPASRDVTWFHAMALLHRANYDIGQVGPPESLSSRIGGLLELAGKVPPPCHSLSRPGPNVPTSCP